jgi:hypothetical protein
VWIDWWAGLVGYEACSVSQPLFAAVVWIRNLTSANMARYKKNPEWYLQIPQLLSLGETPVCFCPCSNRRVLCTCHAPLISRKQDLICNLPLLLSTPGDRRLSPRLSRLVTLGLGRGERKKKDSQGSGGQAPNRRRGFGVWGRSECLELRGITWLCRTSFFFSLFPLPFLGGFLSYVPRSFALPGFSGFTVPTHGGIPIGGGGLHLRFVGKLRSNWGGLSFLLQYNKWMAATPCGGLWTVGL